MKSSLKIHSVESFGTHDGPGIRMVLFLQGCNLHCQYCHNPDTIPIKDGLNYEMEDLIRRAVNMKPYFGKVGGITISGGEPLLQTKALIPFFKALKDVDIHTNIDTNGSVFNQNVISLLDDYTDLVMVDIKHTNVSGYKELTGGTDFNTKDLLINHRENSKKPFWLRYVLIPGYTDSPEELIQMGEKYKSYDYLEKIEIQPFHQLGRHKWEALEKEYLLEHVKENTKEQLDKVYQILKPYFKEVKIN